MKFTVVHMVSVGYGRYPVYVPKFERIECPKKNLIDEINRLGLGAQLVFSGWPKLECENND